MTAPISPHPRRTGGFSLPETLVVFAVLAFLAAVSFAVFGKARVQSRDAVCLTRLKSLVMAGIQYTQDHNGTFPNVNFFNGTQDVDDDGKPVKGIRDYLGYTGRNPGVDTEFTCPTLQVTHRTWGFAMNHNYAINRYLAVPTSASQYTRYAEVPRPVSAAWFMESFSSSETPGKGHYFATTVKVEHRPSLHYPHDGAQQVGYLDGHVQRVSRGEMERYDANSPFWARKVK
ncbi:MAG TPA: type II secretion system protein [Chthoniobacteraceae bacterium]|nr:type II secretion system protein [Chthoniobacteraceae bacterium]